MTQLVQCTSEDPVLFYPCPSDQCPNQHDPLSEFHPVHHSILWHLNRHMQNLYGKMVWIELYFVVLLSMSALVRRNSISFLVLLLSPLSMQMTHQFYAIAHMFHCCASKTYSVCDIFCFISLTARLLSRHITYVTFFVL